MDHRQGRQRGESRTTSTRAAAPASPPPRMHAPTHSLPSTALAAGAAAHHGSEDEAHKEHRQPPKARAHQPRHRLIPAAGGGDRRRGRGRRRVGLCRGAEQSQACERSERACRAASPPERPAPRRLAGPAAPCSPRPVVLLLLLAGGHCILAEEQLGLFERAAEEESRKGEQTERRDGYLWRRRRRRGASRTCPRSSLAPQRPPACPSPWRWQRNVESHHHHLSIPPAARRKGASAHQPPPLAGAGRAESGPRSGALGWPLWCVRVAEEGGRRSRSRCLKRVSKEIEPCTGHCAGICVAYVHCRCINQQMKS